MPSCSSRCITYRSLPSDDPFGEHSAWEHPGDGFFGGWKDVPQEQFAAAVDSDAVRHAHFGPEWARFSTVGKLALQHAVSNPSCRVPSSEQIHDQQVAAKRELLEHHNFQTYDQWVENMVVEEARSEFSACSPSPSTSSRDDANRVSCTREEKKKEEEEIFSLSPEPLPPFMQEIRLRENNTTELSKRKNSGELSASSTILAPSMLLEENSSVSRMESSRNSESSFTLPEVPKEVSKVEENFPLGVLRMVNDNLPPHLGHSSISLQDPYHWNTEDIIQFLMFLTPCEKMDSSSSSETKSVMDDSMISAFQMAEVTGKMLLDVVQPPVLFRIMRRWHIERNKIAQKAWTAHCRGMHEAKVKEEAYRLTATMSSEITRQAEEGLGLPSSMVVKDRIVEGTPQMAVTLGGLSVELIQETILQCFPYGYGRS